MQKCNKRPTDIGYRVGSNTQEILNRSGGGGEAVREVSPKFEI